MKSNLIEPLKGKQMAEGRRRDFEHPQAMARTGREVFMPLERKRPAASPVSKRIAEGAGATAQTLQVLCVQRCDPYYHSGLNE